MPKVYREYEPNQDFLLPPSLKDWLAEGHPAYFISEVVDRMDLSEIFAHYEKEERGQPPYHPRMMTKVLLYGYCMGVRSSRKIARHLEENVAFRVLAANNQPEANASKHKAMSYGRMCEAEKELEEEVKKLLAEAQRIDEEEDKLYGGDRRGDELPKELARRETRLKKIEEAKAVLEAEARRKAKECHSEAEQTEESPPPRKKKRRPPPTERGKPEARAQYNFTDPESRIMKNSDKAYVQAYNALAAVDGANQIIVGCEVSDNPADSVSTVEMVKQVENNCGKKPKRVLADAGHFSEHNVATLEEQGIDVYISTAKQRHTQKTQPAPRGRIPLGLSVKDKMRRKLRTKKGKKTYAKRKWIVEPLFGQIKEARGIRQFLLRGKRKVSGEWSLISTTHNLLKLYLSGRIPVAAPA